MDFDVVSLAEGDVAVISVPFYGGRVPAIAVERLGMIHGNGAKAVLVCVYGNRAYEDTLVELKDTAKQIGFQVIASVSAIAEHSIVRQFAAGRPDAEDAKQLYNFAKQIQKKLSVADTSEPMIPGHRPYKKAGEAGMVPKPTKDCNGCGMCAVKCPVQAIDKEISQKVDEKACISCMRCVTVARKVDVVMPSTVGMMLEKVCSERNKCDPYL